MPANGIPYFTVSINGGEFSPITSNGGSLYLGIVETNSTTRITIRVVNIALSSEIAINTATNTFAQLSVNPNPPTVYGSLPVEIFGPNVNPNDKYEWFYVLDTTTNGSFSGEFTYALSAVDVGNETYTFTLSLAVATPAPSRSTGNAKLNAPTLLYPNGGERILTRSIEILWDEPSDPSPDGLAGWYEIYYSDNYDFTDDPNWIAIAMSVPIGTNRFIWNVGNMFSNNNMRVGIRTVNLRGKRSEMSISADSFSVRRSSPLTPAVLSPLPNSRYGSNITIIFDDAAVANQFGQKARYYVYFRSVKANVPLTCIVQSIPIGSGPIQWDTSLLSPSDDYEVIVYLADDSGNKSQEVSIAPITIYNEGFFLIDTVPPSGYVQINNGDGFTRTRDVSVRLFSYDEITGVHAMRFFESTDSGQETGGPPESYTNLKYWQLSEHDGIKTLKVLFQDFGANRTTEINKPFRVLFDLNNSDISDIISHRDIDGNFILWAGVNGATNSIYSFNPNGSLAATSSEPVNSLAIYNDSLFVAVDTPDDTALVYRYVGLNDLEPTITLTEYSSEIQSMQAYKGALYLGAMNGGLYRYDDNAVNVIANFVSPIHLLYSDSSLLYILLKNSSSMIIFDGTSFKEVSVL